MGRAEEIIRYKKLEKKFSIFRWIEFIVFAPFCFGLSKYSINNEYLKFIILAGCIYNMFITFSAYSKKDRFCSILKITLFIDVVFITIFLCVRGGMRSDTFFLYFLLISYNGAKFGYKGTIISVIQVVIYFSIAAFIFTPQNLFSFNRYLIRICYIIMTTYLVYQINKIINESYDNERQAKKLAAKDVLTNIPNRLLLGKYFSKMKQSYNEFGQPFCIVMFDIDDFKKVNDSMGHTFGDCVLVNLADIIKNNISSNDFVCRFGGEEFIILFSNSDISNAYTKADKIRKEFEHYYLLNKRITISGGICEYKDNFTMIENINFADESMYKAKNTGKNRIVNFENSNVSRCS